MNNNARCELIVADNEFQESYSEKNLYQSMSDFDQDSSFVNKNIWIEKVRARSKSRRETLKQRKQNIAMHSRLPIISQLKIPNDDPNDFEQTEQNQVVKKAGVEWSDFVHKQVSSEQSIIDQERKKEFSQLIVQFHSLKFVKKLLLLLRPDSSFTHKHFDIINDKASTFIVNPIRGKKSIANRRNQTIDFRVLVRLRLRNFAAYLQQVLTNLIILIPLIEPNSNGKFIWNLIMCLIRVYLIVWIPIIMSFPMVSFESYTFLIIVLSSILLTIDVAVRCFTIQFEQGLPVKDRQLLAERQVNIQTFVEVSANIILFTLTNNFQSIVNSNIYTDGWPKIFMILLYPQLSLLFEQIQAAQESITLTKYSASLIELFKLVSLILFIQHVFSCFWAILGQYCDSIGQKNWIQLTGGYTNWNAMYLESLYFISVTMFTVGYGDINPQNVYEKIFCIVFMFLCTLQLSYSVNTIGSILAQIRQQSENIRQKITAVNQYMQNKKISQPLQLQVREYFNFYFQQVVVQQTFEQTEILLLLPEDIRQNLVLEAATSLIQKCQLFSKIFSPETNNQILTKAYFHTFQPAVVISSKTLNLDNEQFICIIEQGLVEVYREKQLISTLKQHQSIGLWEFLHQTKSEFTFKSAGFTSVLVIPFNAFQEIMKDRQLDKEHYFNMIDDLQIGQQCLICANNKHQTQQCKLVQYVPDYEKIIKRYLFHQDQEQKPYSRNKCRNKSFFHAYNDKEFIEDAANMYLLEHEYDIQQIFPIIDEFDEELQTDGQYNTKQIRLTSHEEQEKSDTVSVQIFQDGDIETLQQPQSGKCKLSQSYHEKPKKLEKKHSLFFNYKFGPSQQQVNLNKPSKKQITPQLLQISQQHRSSLRIESACQIFTELNQFPILQKLNKYAQKYQTKEQDQLFYITKSIENIYFDPFMIDNILFEKAQAYTVYHPEWNMQSIIKKMQLQKNMLKNDNKDKYGKYLLYPYQFVWMYQDKHKNITMEGSIQKKKQIMLRSDQYRNQKQKRNIRRSVARVFPDK